MKKIYQMNEEQYKRIILASRPVPYMIIGGVAPRSPQENANDAWKLLGEEMGFDWETVELVENLSNYHFKAESLEKESN